MGTLDRSFQTIGERNAPRIQAALHYKKEQDIELEGFAFTRKGLEAAKQKLEQLKIHNPVVARALGEYFKSLAAWAKGAGISQDEAWYLQNETVGCQTILVRGQNGEVFMAHTEEWEMDNDEKKAVAITPEWTVFKQTPEDAQPLQAFTGYPFALPGSAFGMHNGKITALDSLELKDSKQPGVPANVAAWLCWYLSGEVDAQEVLQSAGPYIDGYAFNEISAADGEAQGRTIEFGMGRVEPQLLGESPLSHRIQTNLVEHPDLAKAHGVKFPKKNEDYVYYQGLKTTHAAVRAAWEERYKRLAERSPQLTLDSLEKEMGLIPISENLDTIPQPYAYAKMFAVMKRDGTYEARISAGPQVPRVHDDVLHIAS